MKYIKLHLTLIFAVFLLLPTPGTAAKPNPEECYLYDNLSVSIAEVYAASCQQYLSTSRSMLGKGLFSREIEFSESDGGICYYYSGVADATWIYQAVTYIGTSFAGECEDRFTMIFNDALISVRECEFAFKDLTSYLASLQDCE